MRLLKEISNFHLELLPKDWVNETWFSNFSDERALPGQLQLLLKNKDYSGLMVILIDAIDELKLDDNSDLSWKTFCDLNVEYRALLCLINEFVKTDLGLTGYQHSLVLTAARLYFVLLSVPGSTAFNILNPDLYEKCIKMLPVKKRQEKLKFLTSRNDESGDSTFELSDEEDLITCEVCLLLDALSNCLKEINLIDEDDLWNLTIEILVNQAQIKTSVNIFDAISITNFTDQMVLKSYKILELLCETKRKDIHRTFVTIIGYFLRNIFENGNYSNIFTFIERLILSHGNDIAVGVKIFIQRLCIKVADKTDAKVAIIPHIVKMLQFLEYDNFQDIVLWILSMAHAEKLKFRLCAIEIVSKLLNVKEMKNVNLESPSTTNSVLNVLVCNTNLSDIEIISVSNKENTIMMYKLLLAAILSRSLDVSPVLRYKCLDIFSSYIFSSKEEIKEIMEELLITSYQKVNNDISVPFFDFQKYFSLKLKKMPLPKNPLPCAFSLMQSIKILAKDRRVHVRKSALNLISNICFLNKFWLNEESIKMFVESCKDYSLMTRKFAVKCLTDLLLKYPSNNQLIEAWVLGVVSLVADSDVKCQDKVIESIGNVILDNLAEYNKSNNDNTKLPWKVMNAISGSGKRMMFRSVCKIWFINKTLTKRTFKIIESHIGTENNFAAWFLFVCITEFQDHPDPKFVSNYFLKEICDAKGIREDISMLVVEAVFLNWKGIDLQAQDDIYLRMKGSLESFNVPLILISRYLDICYNANKTETKILSAKLVQLCEEYLRKYIAPGCTLKICETSLCQHIHTLADSVHFHPGVDNDVINYLASLIDSTSIIDGMTAKWKGTVSNTVKAVAIVALGKICLQNHFIARTYAPVFANVLNEQSHASVKINAMIALSDLCARFTSVVEDYLGDMCVMLKDEDVNVRTNNLKLILQLIQEDYLKPKGALFFYLLITLNDPVSSVREMTEGFISNMVLKHPVIMNSFFIQTIFFFNDYQGPGGFNKAGLSAKERRIFSMAGVKNFSVRGKVYKYMLNYIADKFTLLNKICVEILDEVNAGRIPLNAVGSAVLKDALYVMTCDEMRLINMNKVEIETSDKETEEFIKPVEIAHIVKTGNVEHIIPTITKLKCKLSEIKSPLLRDLMICVRELLKDFREQISEVLHSAPELAAEVVLDLKNICKDDDQGNKIYGDLNNRELRVSCERLSVNYLRDKLGISIEPVTVSNSNIPIIAGPSAQDSSPIVQNSCGRRVVSPNITASPMIRPSLTPQVILHKLSNYELAELIKSQASKSSISTSTTNASGEEKISSQGSSSSHLSDCIKQSDLKCIASVKESRKLRSSQDNESYMYSSRKKPRM